MRVALIWPNGFKVQNTIPLAFGYLKSNIKNKDRNRTPVSGVRGRLNRTFKPSE